jgi:nitroreductase/NAD-dependent dihydropyrimidine dehydrogenase PreA subunit
MFERQRDIIYPKSTTFASFAVDAEKCTGCGRCVRACPIQLLVLDENEKPRPNERYDAFRCITCQNCNASCPEKAITITGDYRVASGFWRNADLYEGTKTWPDPLLRGDETPFASYENELTETERVIYQRRSVRLYKKKPVPRELVHRVLEAGRFAPSAGNNQPWKFIAITDRAVIEEINRICKKNVRFVPYLLMPHAWLDKKVPGDRLARPSWWQKATYAFFSKQRPGDCDQRVLGGINTISSDPEYDTFFGAPALILFLVDKRGIGSPDLDLGICGQTMDLAAHSLGLGTCWVSLIRGVTYDKKYMREKLGIRWPFRIVSSLTLGYPAGQVDNVVKRERPRVNWIEPAAGKG